MSKETPLYLTKQLISYMGNKRKIVPYLEDIIVDIKQKLNVDKLICFDGFSGSGVVSRLLKEHSSILVANDIEPYAETLNRCYLANRSDICEAQIKHYIDLANNPDIRKKYKSYKGIIRQNYCPKKSSKIEPKERVFYTIRNGEIIDAIRNFIKIEISPEYRVYILAQLIVKSSVHSNTCGLFNGFYKKDGVGHYGGKNSNDLNRICKDIVLDYPIFSKNSCKVIVKREDTTTLVKTINKEVGDVFDIVYYDPPYNKHPYGTNYFMLNTINNWDVDKPIPDNYRGQDNNWFRSDYNSSVRAESTFEELIAHTKSKYIIISYNNKGIISVEKFRSILEKYGELEVVTIKHGTYNRLIGQSAYKKIGPKTKVSEFIWILRTFTYSIE